MRGETVGLDTSDSVVSEAEEVREEAASRSDDSSVSLSALVPETTLQEVAEEVTEPGKVNTVDRSVEYFATNINRKCWKIYQGEGGYCG